MCNSVAIASCRLLGSLCRSSRLLDDIRIEDETTQAPREFDGKALSIRRVAPIELVAARARLDNSRCMLPCLIANWRFELPTLSQPIERFLEPSRRLADVEPEFSGRDLVLIRAALFTTGCVFSEGAKYVCEPYEDWIW